jgi:hypothetical protein
MMMRSMNMKVGMTSRPLVSTRTVVVRAEQPGTPPPAPGTTPAQTPPPMPSVAAPLLSKSASFDEVMKSRERLGREVFDFNGSAPEIVNGRLAMLGFVAATGAEVYTGQPIIGQLAEQPIAVGIAFALFIAASLIPLLKRSKVEQAGPFTPSAELLNGRAAMLGFAALLVTEKLTGAAFVFFAS